MAKLDVYEAMRTLRAVRRLKPDPIPDDVLGRVLEAATWAPTGGNAQPWRIVLARRADVKARLGALYAESWARFAAKYQRMIAALPAADQAREQRTVAAGDYLAAHFHEAPAIAVFCFNPKQMAITDAKLERVSVVGGASIYTAVQNLLLACRAEGLGCVLTTLLCEHEAEVNALLEIPDPWGTAASVPMGYPMLRGHGPIRRQPVSGLVYDDRFGAAHDGRGR
jgi:nitroreductase